MEREKLRIAMLSVHSCPIGELGTQDTGGMSVYIRELARELERQAHWVDIYTRCHDPKDQQVIQLYDKVRLIHLRAGTIGRMHKSALYPYLSDFFRELMRFRTREGLHYDLIHSHYWLSGVVGTWVQESWELPHVLMFHTLSALKNMTVEAEQETELRIISEKRLVQRCERILAPTEREKEQLNRHYGAPPEMIGVVPCGVNLDLFRPMERTAARKRLGLNQDDSIVLYVGRFAPLKGIDRLLDAMTHLRNHQRLRLLIIGGNGHHTDESLALQKLSRELGIQDSVSFVGRIEQEELPPYYNAAEVLVVPSHYESFGLVALESLASGTPVVATRVGAMENLIQQGETGYTTHDGSPHSLAKGIEMFISNSDIPPAEAIRASVIKYSWANVASSMINEYETVIEQYHSANRSSAEITAMGRSILWSNLG